MFFYPPPPPPRPNGYVENNNVEIRNEPVKLLDWLFPVCMAAIIFGMVIVMPITMYYHEAKRTEESTPKTDPLFGKGQMVQLKVNNMKGQVVRVYFHPRDRRAEWVYKVRIHQPSAATHSQTGMLRRDGYHAVKESTVSLTEFREFELMEFKNEDSK